MPQLFVLLLITTVGILLVSLSNAITLYNNSSLRHPDPESVALDLQRKVEMSHHRSLSSSCLTGNPIDDCWRCDSKWANDKQRLADCGIGFGHDAHGGKGGEIYVVTDSSDSDPANPKPGTLRYAVIQEDPLWITFSSSMTIKLSDELIVNSFKTLDGRDADVHVTGAGCITLQYVSNIIIHNLQIHNCVPSKSSNVRSSPTHVGYRSKSDGDGISIYGSRKIWIDHCTLYSCTDGLIDAIMGSTGVTISNNFFSHHNDVMLLGHSDDYEPDKSMQVTIAFNRFGSGLVQRMPRCRLGYVHVVNNDFTEWEMYAIGGSANPTIYSQGNRYVAPENANAKEVTKRVDCGDRDWENWDWRSEGDVMVNGAVFVSSGENAVGLKYQKLESVEPKSAGLIDMLTANAGVFGSGGSSRVNNGGSGGGSGTSSGINYGSAGGGGGTSSGITYGSAGGGDSSEGVYDGTLGMFFSGGKYTGSATSLTPPQSHLLFYLLPVMILYLSVNFFPFDWIQR